MSQKMMGKKNTKKMKPVQLQTRVITEQIVSDLWIEIHKCSKFADNVALTPEANRDKSFLNAVYANDKRCDGFLQAKKIIEHALNVNTAETDNLPDGNYQNAPMQKQSQMIIDMANHRINKMIESCERENDTPQEEIFLLMNSARKEALIEAKNIINKAVKNLTI